MKKTVLSCSIQSILASSAIAVSSMAVSQTAQADQFTDALTGGKVNVDVRVRYEGVEQTGKKDATAITERTRIGYTTGDLYGFNGMVEMSGTESLGSRKDYFVGAGPGAGGDSNRAVILDPTITVLNQAWVGYKYKETAAKVGQQRIIFDNRFLGNVGWRQTEQVYTAASLKTKAIPYTEIDYAYLMNVRNPVGVNQTMTSNAIQAKFTGIPFGTITGYGYLLDYDLQNLTDSETYGARFAGKAKMSDTFKLFYHAEYATQGKYANTKGDVGGDYTRFELGVGVGPAKILAGQEKLGGDGKSSFQTPLGTVHLFNGWADMFIGPAGGTPINGLVDNYLSVSGKALGLKLAAIYHDFSADTGGDDYGSEYDLLVAKKFAKIYTVGVKYANYTAKDSSANNNLVDTTKLWVWGEVKF
ncbi:hypothetical protein [Thiomicrospira sp. S5]|uniref:hypothetical protein n=1 Tax=Thiomicrospira sp. S5 TaxID=1803865 RepID=UPI000F8A1FC0|nr:hypothetical protein [Thiomicrospira sp. S5]AZR80886.1 hypothetical protein AYJ59_00415 [Thiomicrospira sp. S5]